MIGESWLPAVNCALMAVLHRWMYVYVHYELRPSRSFRYELWPRISAMTDVCTTIACPKLWKPVKVIATGTAFDGLRRNMHKLHINCP